MPASPQAIGGPLDFEGILEQAKSAIAPAPTPKIDPRPSNKLMKRDLAMFARIGVPPDLLEAAHVERVSDADARERFGIQGPVSRNMAGIVFPYHSHITGNRVTARVRRDNPEIEDGQPKNKYISAYGDGRHLYFPPDVKSKLALPETPIVLVEAEKSGLGLTAWAQRTGTDLLALGLGGCWGWRGRIGKTESASGERVDVLGPLPDLSVCDGRTVYVMLDANTATNYKVQAARAALAKELRKRGCTVLICELPSVGGVNGPDDYIAAAGDEAMLQVFSAAHAPTAKPAAQGESRTQESVTLTATGAEILDWIVNFLRRFVSLSMEQARAAALWIVHTHAIDAADSTPYLSINSAEKQSGKTRLLEVMKLLVREQWFTGRVTAAVLVRKIDAVVPSLLLDESDAAFAGDPVYAETLRGVLNHGHRRGGCSSLCVGQGAAITYKDFSVFCPKAIAGIGKLPDTVADRSVPIRLKRAPRGRVERFRERDAEREAKPQKSQIAAWCKAHIQELRDARPDTPSGLSDRQADVCEPLLAIADAVGGEWPKNARGALLKLCTGAQADDDSVGVRLLQDIKNIFTEKQADEISSTDLCDNLALVETSPWAEWSHGKSLSTVKLAKLLKPFEVYPGPLSSGQVRGYRLSAFEEAFSLYIPLQGVKVSESQYPCGFDADFKVSNDNSSDTSKNAVSVNNDAGSRHLDTLKAGIGAGEELNL